MSDVKHVIFDVVINLLGISITFKTYIYYTPLLFLNEQNVHASVIFY